ncbi:hypothetical protein JKF63_07581 [Porcisia hertigi]|uniref:C2H2-type domain-containing protein n=1 Tax=Porcisia hertigi TaxID=2761500 RepID=A0A837A9P4_9TRYP|nr:hypothetical protein JKF63_07581 [Porcisia hertigi]
MHTAVLRRASTPSTHVPDTTNDNLDSSDVHNGDVAEAVRPQPPVSQSASPEVCFYDTFILSEVDLHLILLEEAHYKHGVWLNVPPQLAPCTPNAGPPAVPEPIYPQAQQARLEAMSAAMRAVLNRNQGGAGAGSTTVAELIRDSSCLAYAPTHDPPPFSTTGTRSLWLPEKSLTLSEVAAAATGDLSTAALTSASTSTTAVEAGVCTAQDINTRSITQNEVQTLAIRKPVDASMTCHCSECGRPFRRRHIAEQHVQQRHRQSSNGSSSHQAVVLDGPGPGEIMGYEDRVVSVATTATTAPAPAPVPAHERRSLLVATAARAKADDGGGEVTTVKGLTGAQSAGKSPTLGLNAAYDAAPRVELPEDALIDRLLYEVWDEVALARDDIEKPSDLPRTLSGIREHTKRGYDSGHGRLYIPSTLFVEGTADNRAELDATAAGRPAARATPEGAAPGIKRRPSSLLTSSANLSKLLLTQRRNTDGTLGADGDGAANGGGIGGGSLGAAPTAQELSITELSRHYPNPFGDSPNATLVESEKEPINPFVDLEGQAAAVAAAAQSSASLGGVAADGGAAAPAQGAKREKWLSRWTARPYACPLCQRRALPDLMAFMAPLLPPSSLTAGGGTTTASETPTGGAGSDEHRGAGVRAAGSGQTQVSVAAASASSSRPAAGGGAPLLGSVEPRPLVEDVEAWSWYDERVPRFRLLDSLEDHLQSEHPGYSSSWTGEAAASADGGCSGGGGGGDGASKNESLSDVDWRRLYSVFTHHQLFARAELLAVHQAYRAMVSEECSASAEACIPVKGSVHDCSNDVGSDASQGIAEDAAVSDRTTGTEDASTGESSSRAAPVTEIPQVHVRSAVNTVLIGTVRDVQEGFVGATRILQYVLAVRNTSTESSGSASRGTMGSDVNAITEDEGISDAEEDLIVVRCIGDLVPVALLKQQVRLGSILFVAGSLRMNRNVDTVSRRSHAYPYVQVVPPLGCVRVLGA